jgi:Ca2+-binding EF-hand superfamily protein
MALSELQRKKIHRLFEVMDVDGDGFLEEVDFTRRADVFAEMRGWTEGSSQYRDHLDFTRDDWRSLRDFADRDGDGRVTRAEFVAFSEDLLSDLQAVEAYAYTDALLIFKAMDADDDGRITAGEYGAYLRTYGLDESAAAEFFRRVDLDRDGYITAWELVEAMRDFLLSSEPEAAGNYLYGPLG